MQYLIKYRKGCEQVEIERTWSSEIQTLDLRVGASKVDTLTTKTTVPWSKTKCELHFIKQKQKTENKKIART